MIQTYAVYLAADSFSAPLAIADTADKAQAIADSLCDVLGADAAWTDHIANRDTVTGALSLPRAGFYRDADNVTMVREVLA